MKRILTRLLLLFLLSTATANFEIIPQGDSGKVIQAVDTVSNGPDGKGGGGKVRDTYDTQANSLKGDVGTQLASGIMTRSTLLDYVVYLIKFLSQAGLLIGAVMIIYAGYIYASSVFTGKEPGAGKKAITNAILGVLVIAFSYAIIRIITAAFIT